MEIDKRLIVLAEKDENGGENKKTLSYNKYLNVISYMTIDIQCIT